jgi:membrane-associated phospholipid phosphatase
MTLTHFFSTKFRLSFISTCITAFLSTYSVFSMPFQSQYSAFKPPQFRISASKDIPLAGVSLLWTGLNLYGESKIDPGTFNRWKIRGVDQWAPHQLNPKTARIADGTALATGVLSLIWISRQRNMQWDKAGIMAENAWITWNITQSSKMLFRRARPYTYASGFSFSKRDDAYSFISGHSSMAASLAASMYFMSRNESCLPGRNNKGIWIAAGGMTLGTAALRVSSGKHFPTDVLAGLLIGTGIAYLNTYLHAR